MGEEGGQGQGLKVRLECVARTHQIRGAAAPRTVHAAWCASAAAHELGCWLAVAAPAMSSAELGVLLQAHSSNNLDCRAHLVGGAAQVVSAHHHGAAAAHLHGQEHAEQRRAGKQDVSTHQLSKKPALPTASQRHCRRQHTAGAGAAASAATAAQTAWRRCQPPIGCCSIRQAARRAAGAATGHRTKQACEAWGRLGLPGVPGIAATAPRPAAVGVWRSPGRCGPPGGRGWPCTTQPAWLWPLSVLVLGR